MESKPETLCACGCGRVVVQDKQSLHGYAPKRYFNNECRIRDFKKNKRRNDDYFFD